MAVGAGAAHAGPRDALRPPARSRGDRGGHRARERARVRADRAVRRAVRGRRVPGARAAQVDVRHPVHLSLLWPWSEAGQRDDHRHPPGDGDEHYYVECLEEQLIQGLFVLDQGGTIWLDEDAGASSIEHFIERAAVMDELMDVQSEWYEALTSSLIAHAMICYRTVRGGEGQSSRDPGAHDREAGLHWAPP